MPDPRSSQRRRAQVYGGLSGSLSSTEKLRIGVLFAFGLVATVTFIGIGSDSGNPDAVTPPPRGEDPVLDDLPIETGEWDPDLERLEELLDPHSATLRAARAPEALNLLAVPVAQRAHVKFKHDPDYADVGGFERVPPEALADPDRAAEFRGRPIEVVGELVASSIVDPREVYQLDPKVFPPPSPLVHGLVDCDGQLVRFLDVQSGRGGSQLPVGHPPGTRFKVMGVFYRLVDEPRGEGEDETLTLPFIVATRATPAIPLEVRDTLPSDLGERLASTEANAIELPPHRDPGFYEALGFVLSDASDAAAARARAGGLELPNRRRPIEHPEEYRLRPVMVRGAVVYLAPESFEYDDMRPEDAPIRRYWHAIVGKWEVEDEAPISVAIPDGRVPEKLRDWYRLSRREKQALDAPRLEVPALFLRVHSFEGRSGERVRYPLVVALETPEVSLLSPERTDDKPFMIGFIAVGFLIAGGLTLMLVHDRRRSQRTYEKLREKRQSRHQGEVLKPPPGQGG